jgi:hypothetical protein
MKRAYSLMIFLLGLVILLSIGKAILQNTLSTSGIFVSEAQREVNFYKTQNAILSEELLTASSLTKIAEEASKVGFVSGNNQFVLKTSNPLSLKP